MQRNNFQFPIGKCPHCGRTNQVLMLSNNPLSGNTICFDCINKALNYQNLSHADFFCRAYNLPFQPELWMKVAEENGLDTFQTYTCIVLTDETFQPNLYYQSSTADLWTKINTEWEKMRTLSSVIEKIAPIKEGYLMRGRLKWGDQYTFEELIQLDQLYTRTIKSNNIISPMQKVAVKTLCQLQMKVNQAIRLEDSKALKEYSSAWSTFAKQANLEEMINEAKTEDITTVAELYQYMEDQGFRFKYFQGDCKDEIDFAIKDIQDTNRRLILESTGLQTQLEEMIRQRTVSAEEEYAATIMNGGDLMAEEGTSGLQDLLSFKAEDAPVDTESDDAVLEINFDETSSPGTTTTIIRTSSADKN